jgi:hypothetical protein
VSTKKDPVFTRLGIRIVSGDEASELDAIVKLLAEVKRLERMQPVADAARRLVHGSAGGWRPALFDALEAAVTAYDAAQEKAATERLPQGVA